MRIAILTHSTNPRGGVVHALELGEALHAAGHQVAVHAPDPRGAGFFRATRCGTVPVRAQAVQGGLVELVQQRIDEYVTHFERNGLREWDVLHAQDAISANALAVLRERGLLPQGFVRTVHHLDSFDDPRVLAWQTRGFTAARRVLCVSRLWCDLLAREHGVSTLQVPNGVDTDRFSPRPDTSDARVRSRYGLNGQPILLAVGGVEARKNTLQILAAFLRVRERLSQAQLVIAGGASLLEHAAYQSRFDAAVRSSGLQPGPGQALVLTGPVPDDDLPALFRSASALVFPSLKEGFGLVVLEALASGTPAVVSRLPPFTEYLAEGDCAWADPHDTASIAAAVRTACDPQSAARLRRAGVAVSRRFTWAASARRHLDIYAHAFGSSREPTHA